MIAIFSPSLGERSLNNCAAMPLATKFVVGYDIFEECVSTPAAQKIWSSNEHAGRCDPDARIGDKHGHIFARKRLGPDAFGSAGWLRDRTHFRFSKEIKQPHQIGFLGEPRVWHLGTDG
jgi:hypothetical protein